MKSESIKKSTIIEAALLKALSIKAHYDNYNDYIVKDRLLDETKILIECYKKYYELYVNHKYIDFDVFLTQFYTHWHSQDMTDDDLDWYKDIIHRIQSSDPVDAETALLGLVNKQFISKINEIGAKEFNSEHIRVALEDYEKNYAGIVKEYDDDAFTIDDIDLSLLDKSLGIPYCFDQIQDNCGGMIKGSLVIINAATNLGKSMIIYKQIRHTLNHLKNIKSQSPILLFHTEGTKDVAFARILSNIYRDHLPNGFYDIQTPDMLAKIKKHFNKKYGKNSLYIFTANNCGLNYIRMKIKKYNPALVILDMAVQIMTPFSKTASDVGNLEAFFNALRRLSSENCPIMATVQAGNGAKWWDKQQQKYLYKQWPTDDDIYNSKTAVQGAAETIITMGRDNDNELKRYIQTTKTKSENTAKFVCKINKKYNDFEIDQEDYSDY